MLPVTVYTALDVPLFVWPGIHAIALIVAFARTTVLPLASVAWVGVGVEPSTVQLIEAPGVADDSTTPVPAE
jgi:hypothetical protein